MQSIAERDVTFTHRTPKVFNDKNTSNKYITKTKILNQLGYEYNSSNERWLRRVINSLVYDYGYPIDAVINLVNVVITSLRHRTRKATSDEKY